MPKFTKAADLLASKRLPSKSLAVPRFVPDPKFWLYGSVQSSRSLRDMHWALRSCVELAHVRTCMYLCICMYIYICMCRYVCLPVINEYMYIYIHICVEASIPSSLAKGNPCQIPCALCFLTLSLNHGLSRFVWGAAGWEGMVLYGLARLQGSQE